MAKIPSSRSSLSGLNRDTSIRTCVFRTEFKIVVFAFRIAAKARSSGSRENPRIGHHFVQGHVHGFL